MTDSLKDLLDEYESQQAKDQLTRIADSMEHVEASIAIISGFVIAIGSVMTDAELVELVRRHREDAHFSEWSASRGPSRGEQVESDQDAERNAE